jgi:signal transduction histidine kinase
MNEAMHSLPAVLVLGTLVAIFFALQRRHRSPRVRLWVLAWCLIFLRFAVDLVPTHSELIDALVSTFQLTGLSLAGFVFLISVSPIIERRRPAAILLTQFTVACLGYSALVSWQVTHPWPYVACLVCVFAGGAAWIAYGAGRPLHAYIISLASVGFGTWGVIAALRGNFSTGLFLLLFVSYAAAALVFFRAYRQWTPGLLATSLGMAAWSIVWAVQLVAPQLSENPAISAELWNVPKFIVAFGMILLLLEEESRAAETAREREHRLKIQVQRFADVTSHLLMGQEVRSFCGEIAQVLVEATTFRRVAILLADDRQQMHLTGYAGLSEADLQLVKEATAGATTRQLEEVCACGRLIGRTAIICRDEQLNDIKRARSQQEFEPNPFWNAGDELFVPLRSRSGKLVGLFSLDDPEHVERVTAEEMSTIEVLGGDLAVAIENAELQRQLVQSEKLAGVGQLVGGVAHELNNPLAVILGYSELLAERATADETLARGLESMRRESLRMKQIISNLQHFARASKTETAVTDLACVVRDVCTPRSSDLEARGIQFQVELESDLPNIGMSAHQFAQVLGNLINNAVDATDKLQERCVTVQAKRNGRWATINVIDNGPGFTDTQRAFDPFFTTKQPGKGTGLGLSLCYGLIRQQGGCISAHNLAPTGACVTIELPVVEAKVEAKNEAGTSVATRACGVAASTTNGTLTITAAPSKTDLK